MRGPRDRGRLLGAATPDAGFDAASDDAGASDANVPDAGALDAGRVPPERCDEEGETCCPDGTCGAALACESGLCTFPRCGERDGPCCAGGTCAIGSGLACEGGACVEPGCGSDGHPCCAEGAACREDFVCHEGSCLRCGAVGERCCPGEVCDGDLHCLTDRGPPGQCVTEPPASGGQTRPAAPKGHRARPASDASPGRRARAEAPAAPVPPAALTGAHAATTSRAAGAA